MRLISTIFLITAIPVLIASAQFADVVGKRTANPTVEEQNRGKATLTLSPHTRQLWRQFLKALRYDLSTANSNANLKTPNAEENPLHLLFAPRGPLELREPRERLSSEPPVQLEPLERLSPSTQRPTSRPSQESQPVQPIQQKHIIHIIHYVPQRLIRPSNSTIRSRYLERMDKLLKAIAEIRASAEARANRRRLTSPTGILPWHKLRAVPTIIRAIASTPLRVTPMVSSRISTQAPHEKEMVKSSEKLVLPEPDGSGDAEMEVVQVHDAESKEKDKAAGSKIWERMHKYISYVSRKMHEVVRNMREKSNKQKE